VTRTNHFVFHQYQLVCIQEKVSMADLLATIEYLFKSYLGDDVVIRFRNKYYPEVEPGVGPDMQCFNCHGAGCAVCKNRGWIEMGGAGIRHPNMLKMAGIDPEKWQGFAFGLGLDRWAMAKHKITDIRTLLGGNLAYKPNVN
ncbi:partial Phenylalanine--tRNA ligase alpha subunit, partial [uncultured bacterium]